MEEAVGRGCDWREPSGVVIGLEEACMDVGTHPVRAQWPWTELETTDSSQDAKDASDGDETKKCKSRCSK